MTVTSVMHFVNEPTTTAEWWAKQFGGNMQVDEEFAWFRRGDVEVGFHPGDQSKNPTGASTVVYWQVDDLDTSRTRLIDAGCEPWRGPLDLNDGRSICQLKDPFGIVFGLEASSKTSKTIPAVIITGTIGAGKTTVAEEVSDVLTEHNVRHALLDLDWLAQLYPSPDDDPYNDELLFRNLASVWTNLKAAGANYLVMARVIEDAADLHRYQAVIPEGLFKVVRVMAPPDVRHDRIIRREVGGMRDWHLTRTHELESILDGVSIEDFQVSNEGRPIREVADEVIGHLGWLQGEAAST